MDLGRLLQSSPHPVVVVHPDGTLAWANDAARVLLTREGVVPDVGVSLLGLLEHRHRAQAGSLLDLAATGAEGSVHLRLEGEPERWISVRGTPAEGGTVQLSFVDVTPAVLARRRMRSSEARFRAAFDAGITGMALLDADGRVALVNDALAAFLGRPADALAGLTPDEVLHPEDGRPQRRTDGRAVRRPVRHVRPSGEVRYGLVTTVDLEGDPPLALLQVEDVTDRRTSEQRLRHLALHDALTDLPGRPLVLSRLEAALSQPDPGLVAVLFVDLDGFKLVNDALGHAAGDQVLVESAERLRDAVRAGDTVGRFGGDEFIVVCPRLASREEGLLVARRIERAVAAPFPYADDEVLVSASVGVAFAEPGPDGPPSGDALVHDADTAMYRAKQLGKRRYEVFDQAMRERAAERARVEQLLARAVQDDRVVVAYQPVVELSTRRVVGLEALMRVRDDGGELLLPDAFLDVAQQSGVLPHLDDVVLTRATRDVAGWRDALGLDLEVAVNVCADQVTAELPEKVDRALRASGLPADRLVVELTEQTLVSSAPVAGRTLQRLVDRGVRLAIDDFGTGWASLTYLRRFPVHCVKVDRSFVDGLPHEADDLVIVKAVVDLARQLGLTCVAEGVETEEQYEALVALAPTHGQGWLFGRPLLAEDVPGALLAGAAVPS